MHTDNDRPGLGRVEHLMGTVFSFDLRPPLPEAATADTVLDEQVAWLTDIENIFTTYHPDSFVRRLGRGEIELSDCPPVVATVLKLCESFRILTDGWFDVRAGGTLDPSGLVKGWAVQQVSAALTAAGCPRHCVNGGGDVAVVGGSAPDRPWRVGVAHPQLPGALAGVVSLTDGAVASSGTAERGAHILDPRTSGPAAGIAGVTVRGPDLTHADVYATAAVAMGRAAMDWLPTLAPYEALLIPDTGDPWQTPDW